ncbi:hypothetical protein AT705_21140 [Pseudoalteromonas rubra]|uniref:Uncharacterized protein n=2 Tax=Pseudoalteromonas rubra TaxID=43658 RepID=A0A0U3GR00_9GAMM|nr:hypothetical protein AT705_21140 [Pseudoalteromonas rubra]
MIARLVRLLTKRSKPKRWADQPFEYVEDKNMLWCPCVKGPLEKGSPILKMLEEGTLTMGHVRKDPYAGLYDARNYDWREDPDNQP